jgi:hypothetical protein
MVIPKIFVPLDNIAHYLFKYNVRQAPLANLGLAPSSRIKGRELSRKPRHRGK